MKLWALATLPVAWVTAFLLGVWCLPEALASSFIRVEIESAKLLALVGCVVAARAFSRGDYLRTAWAMHAACYALLLTRDAIFLGVLRDGMAFGLRYVYVQALLVTGANGCAMVGSIMLARAWRVAGLENPGRPVTRVVATALWILLSVSITGRATMIDARQLASGHLEALVGLSSDVTDLLSMCLIAPVFFTALALRGGLLRWPWALVTAGLLFWLLYDAGLVLAEAFSLEPLSARVLRESFRGAACLYSLVAGLAQQLVLRDASRRLPRAPAPPVASTSRQERAHVA